MNIYDLFNNLDATKVEEYIRNKQEENLFLEFKTVFDAGFSNRDDRKNFAITLSGFANSSGGIIIWGVVTAKKGGVGCANGRKEIEPLSLFSSKLNELTGMSVSPTVEEVQHKKIETTEDKGFVATFVPESDSGPHMAKGGVDRYMKRSGDRFAKMEHYDIEDMFGRRKKPKLSLATKIFQKGSSSDGRHGKIYNGVVVIGIKNTGRGIAKYPFLSVNVHPPYKVDVRLGLDGGGRNGLPRLIKGIYRTDFLSYGANADIVIHPGTIHEVTAIRFSAPKTSSKIDDLIIDSEIVAEDVKSIMTKTVIKGDEILKGVIPEWGKILNDI